MTVRGSGLHSSRRSSSDYCCRGRATTAADQLQVGLRRTQSLPTTSNPTVRVTASTATATGIPSSPGTSNTLHCAPLRPPSPSPSSSALPDHVIHCQAREDRTMQRSKAHGGHRRPPVIAGPDTHNRNPWN
jgi:hypothetical protein